MLPCAATSVCNADSFGRGAKDREVSLGTVFLAEVMTISAGVVCDQNRWLWQLIGAYSELGGERDMFCQRPDALCRSAEAVSNVVGGIAAAL